MKKSKFLKHIVLMVTVVLTGLLLIFALLSSEEFGKQIENDMVSTETTYIIFALAVCLPIALFALSFFIRRKRVIYKVNSKKAESSQQESAKEQEESEGNRFFKLTKTDEKMASAKGQNFNEPISLEEFCTRFRNFSASKLGLYYDIAEIRKFVASIAVSKIVVMQGMSGTGKTSLAFAFGEFLQNSSTIVPIQPMWKERTDLIGYYNEFTKKFNETTLLQKLYEANYSDDMYITVLDEMNIARVEYYFAEFLSLLEIPNEEGRYLEVVSDEWDCDPKLFKDGKIKLPSNMWFVGTANNDDSTFAISDKVYDRAMVMNLNSKAKAFEAPMTEGVKLSRKTWERLVANAKKEYEITQRNLRRINEFDKYLIENYELTFGNRIMKQLKEYVAVYIACGGSEIDAIDDIMAKKVLRKLEAKNPVLVRSLGEKTRSYLKQLFGEKEMTSCKKYLLSLERNS